MKKIFLTGLIITILIITSFGAGFFVKTSSAVVPLPFGGRLIAWLPCTCSASFWMLYAGTPDSPFPGGPLSYTPYATMVYSYYNMFTPGVWHLGQYLAGVQSCWLIVHHGCIPLPVIGQELQVGTSLTPGL